MIFRDSTKVQFKNDNVQAFDTKWDEALSAVTHKLRDSTLESLYASLKFGRIEILVASLRSRDDFRRQEV